MSHSAQVAALVAAINPFASANGESLAQEMELKAELFLAWNAHLSEHCLTGVADELLAASVAAVREATALVAIGAVRPCLFSLRAQIDLVLGWLYFKDHAVEYATLKRTGEGFKLKKDVLIYLRDYAPGYGDKFACLSQAIKRREVDPYRLLSAHIHAQSGHVIPKVDALSDIIFDLPIASQCVLLQFDVSEYLSDVLFACEPGGGHFAMPTKVTDQIRSRLNPAQLAVTFASCG